MTTKAGRPAPARQRPTRTKKGQALGAGGGNQQEDQAPRPPARPRGCKRCKDLKVIIILAETEAVTEPK